MLIYPGDELTSQPFANFQLSPRLIIRPEALFVGSAGGIDLARNKPLTAPASLSWQATPTAVAAKFSGGAGAGFTLSGGRTTAQTKVTFLAVVCIDTSTAYQGILATSTASTGGFSMLDPWGSGTQVGITKNAVEAAPVYVTLTAGKHYALAASLNQGSGEYYVLAREMGGNSILRAASTTYTSTSAAGNGVYGFGVGRSDIAALNGKLALGVISFDFLPEPAAREFVRNPWGIFASGDSAIWFPDSAGDASASLVGREGTASAGNAAPNLSASISGVSATSAVGSVSPSTGATASISGATSTASVGSLSPEASSAVAGSQTSTAAGTTTVGLSKALTGSAATASTGTLSPTVGATATLSGTASTTATGALAATLSITLGGTSATTSAGTLALPGSYSAALSASQTTSSAGTVSPSISKAIVGAQSTTAVGTPSATTSATASLSGVQASSATGALSISVTAALAGCQSTTFAGALGKIAQVSGQGATTSVGTLNASTEPFVAIEVMATRTVFVKPKRSTDITIREKQKSVTVMWS